MAILSLLFRSNTSKDTKNQPQKRANYSDIMQHEILFRSLQRRLGNVYTSFFFLLLDFCLSCLFRLKRLHNKKLIFHTSSTIHYEAFINYVIFETSKKHYSISSRGNLQWSIVDTEVLGNPSQTTTRSLQVPSWKILGLVSIESLTQQPAKCIWLKLLKNAAIWEKYSLQAFWGQ